MSRSTFAATAALACVAVLAVTPAAAQVADSASVRLSGSCSSGLVGGGAQCSPERRLAIDVRARGAGLTDPGQVLSAVGLGASAGGAFFLPLSRATAADSALYAVVDVERGADRGFRVEARLAGPRAPRAPAVDPCWSTGTGSDTDIGFGAYLATRVAELARCAQWQRGLASR